MWASCNGHAKIVDLLLKNGAQVDLQHYVRIAGTLMKMTRTVQFRCLFTRPM